MYAIVDDEDFDMVSQNKWHFSYGYAKSKISGKTVYMHRVILDAPKGMEVDHINGNKLDNRKENIRLCTTSQNQLNAASHKDSASKYRGVCFLKHKKQAKRPWRAMITVPQVGQVFIGNFATEVEAAIAYNAAATKYHGEFARLNQVGE